MRTKPFYYLILLLSLQVFSASAQQRLTFRVAEFHQDPLDLSARSEQYKRSDDNGSLYSIVKVTTDIAGDNLSAFHFDFGLMNSIPVIHEEDGELWIYVQKNAKTVTIRREGYMTINKYDLGLTIESGNTYVMKLSVQTPEVRKRVLQFKVTPANEGAIVKVKREGAEGDYELWGPVDNNGNRANLIETGTYLYEVVAEHYDKSEGRIALSYAEDNYVEGVTLRPKFGYLEVADEYGIAGADIYVNDKAIGKVPYTKKDRWDVGDDYRIMISNGELYKTYTSTFAIRKGETTRLTPKLESNFAETTLIVDNNAEIFIEGTKRGNGKWSGPLKAGTYSVECRLDNRYRPTRQQITIRPDQSETFKLNAPVPITGGLFVNSSPLGATIHIDGKEVGQTPKNLGEILIGRHTVRILHDGYRQEETSVEVTEGQTAEVNIQLRDEARFTINAEPQAHLTLDGKDVGLTPYSFDGASGDYDIRLTRKKYKTYHQKTALRSSAPNQMFHLQRQYQLPTCGYIQASIHAGTLMGASAHAGTYIYNVNVEAFGLMGLSKETVYLNYTDGTASQTENLKATLIGGKIGYGITIGNRLRITPQVGAASLTVKSDDITATALCATIGCRVDYALTSFLGLNLTPEGQFAVSKKDVFTQLSDLSSKVKGWGTGFGARLGLYFYF